MLGDRIFRHWRAGLAACLLTMPAWGAGFIVDGDGDGVPFEMDECPYTRPGQSVDAFGCSDLPDADEDGIPDVDDRCPVSPPGASIDPEGCSIDSDGDGVPDGIDRCPNTPITTVPDSTGCSASQRLVGAEPRVIVGRPVDGRSPARTTPPSATAEPFRSGERVARSATDGGAGSANSGDGLSGQAAQSDSGMVADGSRQRVAMAPTSAGLPARQATRSRPSAGETRQVAAAGDRLAFQAAMTRVLWGVDLIDAD